MTDQKYDIYKAAGIIIKDRKLLVDKSFGKDFYVSPGGKIETGETPIQALIRELNEEVSIVVNEKDIKVFGTFFAQSVNNTQLTLKMDVFLINSWQGEIAPSHEIESIAWVTSENSDQLPLGSVFEKDVIPKLKSLNLID